MTWLDFDSLFARSEEAAVGVSSKCSVVPPGILSVFWLGCCPLGKKRCISVVVRDGISKCLLSSLYAGLPVSAVWAGALAEWVGNGGGNSDETALWRLSVASLR